QASQKVQSWYVSVGGMADTTTRWEQLWLPIWPLASDDLKAGIYRDSRHNALSRRYIEANPQAVSNLLVVDIDHEDALLRSIWDRDGWRPNAVVENPANGHAHAVWALAEPITRTEYARRKPLAYAAAVTEGLRRSVDGDKSYSGLMTKNPEHDQWDASWWSNELYTLPQLDEHLASHDLMPPRSWRRTRRKNPVGLGRNCSIFETASTRGPSSTNTCPATTCCRHAPGDAHDAKAPSDSAATAQSPNPPEPGPTENSATTSETPTASTSLSATTYTNSTPSSPNHSPQTKPTKSPPAYTNGSPPNPACGQTDQPSTKQPSPPSRQHADAKVANLEDLINEKRCLISSRKANFEHSVQTSSKWLECPRTRRKSGSITPKYHQLDL